VTTPAYPPRSANLFGGRGVTLRNAPSRTVSRDEFPDAPYTLKMACGENAEAGLLAITRPGRGFTHGQHLLVP